MKRTKSKKSLGMWIAVGTGVGAAIGAATESLALWTAIGVAVRVAMGFTLRK